MGTLLLASWLPSLYVPSAISICGAVVFVAWIFLDCSFPIVARMANQDIRLQFVNDAHLRWWHRWEWYGPRLWAFAILAAVSGTASLTAIFQHVFAGASQRGWTGGLLVTAVVIIWLVLFTQYRRLWWIAFTRRVARLQPAMKAAAGQLLLQWPKSNVFLPGLGNYGVSCHDANHLLNADRNPVLDLWETVGGISFKPGCYLGFGISSYMHPRGNAFRGCRVEYRINGWSPPSTSVTDVRSPPHTKIRLHEYDFPLGGQWYLAFYSSTLEFKDEVDPDVHAEVAKRPPATRLPCRGRRFRALRNIDARVEVLYSFPGGDRFPMGVENRVLPKGEVVRLDYEPDPSRSTHCTLLPEDYEKLEFSLVEPGHRNDRDYAGYRVFLSYIELDKDFEWLEESQAVMSDNSASTPNT